ncbi:hypothetical protein SAMN06893097_101560 [Geodermatophilus sabuli]|uniref:Uncharacterized protein n=1 Tax=Geodermatophilus sabuli TaxID=1564158 RepID=A0A285E7E0_9ACTN|nr:hypothetical protein SAMN06893097_101560 [Geodermatophilus sabuli]
MVGELLAVAALLLFSADVVLVGAATRRVRRPTGWATSPGARGSETGPFR